MIKARVNGKTEFEIEEQTLNGEKVDWDLIELEKNSFHIIRNHKSYNATVVSFHREQKTVTVRVNGNDYEVTIRDKYDLLLQQLGISNKISSATQRLQAPMPGLIIQVMVKDGDEVKKGDPLLILEAMKMENVIKSPRDGRVKKISIALHQAVEKNQVLLEFE